MTVLKLFFTHLHFLFFLTLNSPENNK